MRIFYPPSTGHHPLTFVRQQLLARLIELWRTVCPRVRYTDAPDNRPAAENEAQAPWKRLFWGGWACDGIHGIGPFALWRLFPGRFEAKLDDGVCRSARGYPGIALVELVFDGRESAAPASAHSAFFAASITARGADAGGGKIKAVSCGVSKAIPREAKQV